MAAVNAAEQMSHVCGDSMRMRVNLHVWAWKTACPDALPYLPGVPTGTSIKSMLLAKPWPPAPGGNAAIDYMLMQLCRHTWPPADPQHAPEKLQLLEQTQRVPTLKSQFSTHQYPDGDRRVSCRKGNIRAILSWRWLFSVAHEVNGISLKFHRIPAKPICHVRFLLFSGPELISFSMRTSLVL